jgi:hypothetical protein
MRGLSGVTGGSAMGYMGVQDMWQVARYGDNQKLVDVFQK